jgi:hypothetical protein
VSAIYIMDQPRRVPWLVVAVILGAGVFIAQVMTTGELHGHPHWLAANTADLIKHFSGLTLFGLSYRLSYPLKAPGAALATIAVCSGWGACCEVCQHFIPARDFSVIELGVNMLAPALVAGIFALAAKWAR